MNQQFDLERAALGELDASALGALRERFRQQGRDLDAEIASLHQDAKRLFERHPPKDFAHRVHQRAANAANARTRGSRLSWWMGGSAVACAAVILLVVAIPTPEQGAIAPPDIRAKGDVLQLWLLDAKGVSLDDNAPVFAGDTIRLRIRAPKGTSVAVASIDGAGHITHHSTGTDAATLTTSSAVELPFSYTLDAAPAFERFFLIQADRPLHRNAIEAAIVDKKWPPDWTVVEKTLVKPADVR